MNIAALADNLRNTIAGKEKMLGAMNPDNPYSEEFKAEGEVMARRATIEFLKINIAELRRILRDVEQCQEYNQYQEGFDAGGEHTIQREQG